MPPPRWRVLPTTDRPVDVLRMAHLWTANTADPGAPGPAFAIVRQWRAAATRTLIVLNVALTTWYLLRPGVDSYFIWGVITFMTFAALLLVRQQRVIRQNAALNQSLADALS